jgi:hypothetical protein
MIHRVDSPVPDNLKWFGIYLALLFVMMGGLAAYLTLAPLPTKLDDGSIVFELATR